MESGGGVKLDTHNLRDLLRMKDEDHHNNLNHCSASNGGEGRSNSSGLTLLALLTEKVGQPSPADESLQSVQSSRTLLDIIREDRLSGYGGGRSDGGRSWRQLRDKIRLRQRGRGRGSSCSSSVPIQAADADLIVITPRRHSDRFNSSFHSAESTHSDLSAAPDVAVRIPDAHRISTLEAETPNGGFDRTSSLPRSRSEAEVNHRSDEHPAEQDSADVAAGSEEPSEQPARTSLMSLLAQNDRQTGAKGLMCEDLKESVESGSGGEAAEYNNCCVCMVRQKGAAFIPCGHTFCRLCSRELWVERGSCPICNNHIIEILDIF